MSSSESGSKTENDKTGGRSSLLASWRREFRRTEPTRLGDLVVFPLGVSATIGLIAGVWFAAHRHFLDPAFIAYSIVIDVLIQIVILALALAIAFITRRRVWSGVLFAIAFFCFLAIPDLVKLVLPGVAHILAWCIGLLGAFQIARAVNRHRLSRFAVWMIAVPALVSVCVLSYGRARELSQRAALPPAPNSPNVLIIIVDTLRADHVSSYGYARNTSPYLDSLAQQGVLFENAIAPSSWTLPSHASILTGLYPHEIQMETYKSVLTGNHPTLADAMEKRGYRTAAFSGNYHFFSRDRGFLHGFSHFEEYEQSIGGLLEKVPFSAFIFKDLSKITAGSQTAFFGLRNAASAEKIDQDALDWLKTGRRPFFVVLNYIDIHEPVLPPEPYLHAYTTNPKARNESMFFQEDCEESKRAFCASERPQFVDTYDGAVRYADDSVKHLLSELREQGMLENTIVVITSDHGQELGDHDIYGHGKSTYWQEIQVPLIILKPGLIPAAVRVPTPVSTSEIPATILDLVAPGENHADKLPLPGQSLAPLWRPGESPSSWPEPISELAPIHGFDPNAPNYSGPVQSIVTSEWHYIRQQGKDLLFNWKSDPGETHDQCAAQPTVCAALKTQLQATLPSRFQAH
jgi:arylsulfatase A-like enzyme